MHDFCFYKFFSKFKILFFCVLNKISAGVSHDNIKKCALSEMNIVPLVAIMRKYSISNKIKKNNSSELVICK